jgi:hypothetical protein
VGGWAGGTLKDTTHRGHDLTAVNNTTTSTLSNGMNAYHFNGTNYLTAEAGNDLNCDNVDMSIAIWCKNPTNAYNCYVGNGDEMTDSTYVWGFAYDNGDLADKGLDFGVYTWNWNDDGNLHFFVATMTASGEMEMYVDGVSLGKNINPDSTNRSRGMFPNFFIGTIQNINNHMVQGDIGDVYLWHRIITEAEVKRIWNNGLGKSYPFN